jgi:CO dehydrogenase maturation factor
MNGEKPVFAVCGKGGVGKTAFSALLARAFLEQGTKPLLLIDGDSAGGLVSAIGEKVGETLAGVRENLISAARRAGDSEKMRLAEQIDYLVLEALLERPDYSLLAMGRSREKGCFCPANKLLRESIDLVSEPFALVIIDAEAGLEQINREVTRRVTQVVGITDGSQRSGDILGCIAEMVGKERLSAVANRISRVEDSQVPEGVELLGSIPEDPTLRQFDLEGRSLWELPPENESLVRVQAIARKLRAQRSAGKTHPEG